MVKVCLGDVKVYTNGIQVDYDENVYTWVQHKANIRRLKVVGALHKPNLITNISNKQSAPLCMC